MTSSPYSWRSGNSANVAQGCRNDLLVADGDSGRRPYGDVRAVVVAQGVDTATLPDLRGYAEDVSGWIREPRIESCHVCVSRSPAQRAPLPWSSWQDMNTLVNTVNHYCLGIHVLADWPATLDGKLYTELRIKRLRQ